VTLTQEPRSAASISVNRVVSDNSTPTNEPVIDGTLLHVLDPRFDRFTTFNFPGRNYRQEEERVTLNYTREFSPQMRAVEVFGYRAVQDKIIGAGDFMGTPSNRAHTVTMYPFSQQTGEDIFYQELRLELMPRIGRPGEPVDDGPSSEWNSGALSSDFNLYNEAYYWNGDGETADPGRP
jgi:hypothetical protein